MSFSGLKTAVRNYALKPDSDTRENISASFQEAVIDVLRDRVMRAVKKTGVTTVAISGGVAANSGLRAAFLALDGISVFLPPRSRCTDNASMIAHAGRLHLLAGERGGPETGSRSNWQLDDL